jgi:ribosomal protein S27AE
METTMNTDETQYQCSKCGTSVGAEDKVCPKCGESIKETNHSSRFLYIPTARLIILSIVSMGLYEAYWIYKNWKYIKERENLNIQPFWRGIFCVFFCHDLFKRIYNDTQSRAVLEPSFSHSGLATGFVILVILSNLIVRIPGITASIIAAIMPSYLCFVPVQNYINSVHEKQTNGDAYYGWSGGHIVCLVFGIIFWTITFIALDAR